VNANWMMLPCRHVGYGLYSIGESCMSKETRIFRYEGQKRPMSLTMRVKRDVCMRVGWFYAAFDSLLGDPRMSKETSVFGNEGQKRRMNASWVVLRGIGSSVQRR